MSFGGHVLDMIKRANQSKGSGSSRFKKIRDHLSKKGKYQANHREKVKLSPEELRKIKEEVRSKVRKELRVEIIITGAVLFIFFLGMYFFISYLFS